MSKQASNWIYFFILRLVGVLSHRVNPHQSRMSKYEFVYSRIATRCAFFSAGIMTSPWASIMPYVKERLDLNAMHYASLILCYGLGAVILMPFTGKLASRFGIKPLILMACLGVTLGMNGLSHEHLHLVLAYCCVLLWGMSLGLFDVANNIHGAYVEEEAGRHLMSSFHAWYAVGCITSALFCALSLHLGLHTFYLTLSLAFICVALLFYYYGKLINTHGTGVETSSEALKSTQDVEVKKRLIPVYLTFPVLIIGIICLIMYLTEGMIYDWSAVYLINNAAVDITIASVGYLAYQIAIAIMRFKGDSLVTSIGATKLIVGGAVIACASLVTIALSENAYLMVVGFFICGLAIANVVPVMLSETARISGVNQGKAISFVGTLGYSGLLLGPGVLGMVATLCGLRGMFIFTASLVFGLGLMSFYILRKID